MVINVMITPLSSSVVSVLLDGVELVDELVVIVLHLVHLLSYV